MKLKYFSDLDHAIRMLDNCSGLFPFKFDNSTENYAMIIMDFDLGFVRNSIIIIVIVQNVSKMWILNVIISDIQ